MHISSTSLCSKSIQSKLDHREIILTVLLHPYSRINSSLVSTYHASSPPSLMCHEPQRSLLGFSYFHVTTTFQLSPKQALQLTQNPPSTARRRTVPQGTREFFPLTPRFLGICLDLMQSASFSNKNLGHYA